MSTSDVPARTGYAPVNGLQMDDEVHGSGGTPLLLLHGGLVEARLGRSAPRRAVADAIDAVRSRAVARGLRALVRAR